MTKKILFGMMAATMMIATSCENELDLGTNAGKNAQVTFSVGTPEIATRAYSDGLTAKVLQYAVYDSEGNILSDLTETDATINGSTTVNLQLTTGDTYSVIFWAAAENAPYTVNFDEKTMTVSYDGAKSNDETRDAFYKYHTFTVTGAQTETVELRRPFAQLNIGAADYAASASAGYTPTQSAVVVKNVYSTLNLASGAVSDDVVAEFALADIKKDETFPVAGNEYLAMNYLLVGADKETVEVEFSYTDGSNAKTRTVGSVPVQRNYRTNIIGSLLTNPATFNIIIDADFIDSPEKDYIVSVWDGESVETPTVDANNVIRISSAAELVGLMEVTGNSIFIGKTIELQCNIDLGHHRVKGIGGGSNFGGSNFAGVFDGKGFTISNFEVDARDRSYYAGLFNQVSHGGTIKNLTVANATIKGNSMVGAVASSLDSDAAVENCKAINCTLIGVKKVGSVVGYSAGSTVKDCYAENCTIQYSEKEAGEVLGFENTGSTVSGNTFNNITFVASATALAKEMTPVDGVITLTRDYIVTGDWTSLALSGTVTINGNNHTIKGINQPLVAGNAGINITVNDLTITESEIGIAANEKGLGTAAFISYIDYSGKASFTNCHLLSSKVTGNERAAALLAFSEASEVSIKNCSVVGCELKSVGGAAGLVAYTHSTTTVENSKVENTIVESTEDRTSKTALAGAVIGTVNANTTFTNVTVSGNTVKNNGADAHSDMVGRVVSGTLTVN